MLLSYSFVSPNLLLSLCSAPYFPHALPLLLSLSLSLFLSSERKKPNVIKMKYFGTHDKTVNEKKSKLFQ